MFTDYISLTYRVKSCMYKRPLHKKLRHSISEKAVDIGYCYKTRLNQKRSFFFVAKIVSSTPEKNSITSVASPFSSESFFGQKNSIFCATPP